MTKKKSAPLTNERAWEIWEALVKNASRRPSATVSPEDLEKVQEQADRDASEARHRFKKDQADYESDPCPLPERLRVFMACLAYHSIALEDRVDAELRGKKYTSGVPGVSNEEIRRFLRAWQQTFAKKFCQQYGAAFEEIVTWMRKDIRGITEQDVKLTADEAIRRGFAIEATEDVLYNYQRRFDITDKGRKFAKRHGLSVQHCTDMESEDQASLAASDLPIMHLAKQVEELLKVLDKKGELPDIQKDLSAIHSILADAQEMVPQLISATAEQQTQIVKRVESRLRTLIKKGLEFMPTKDDVAALLKPLVVEECERLVAPVVGAQTPPPEVNAASTDAKQAEESGVDKVEEPTGTHYLSFSYRKNHEELFACFRGETDPRIRRVMAALSTECHGKQPGAFEFKWEREDVLMDSSRLRYRQRWTETNTHLRAIGRRKARNEHDERLLCMHKRAITYLECERQSPDDWEVKLHALMDELTDRQLDILQALVTLRAFDKTKRVTTARFVGEIGDGRQNPENFKEPVSVLSSQHLVETRKGSQGGVWLTSAGRRLGEYAKVRRNQR